MIKNYPSYSDYEKTSIQNLVQAIDIVYRKHQLLSYQMNVSPSEYWEYHHGVLNNSLTLLFLGLENFLKSKICKESKLLILSDEPRCWKSKNNGKDFNELYLHSFDNLLIIYQEITSKNLEKEYDKLEELRKKRNKITHGLIEENITPEYIVDIFHMIVNLWENEFFWKKFKEYHINDPAFGHYKENYEKSSLVKYVHFFEKYCKIKKTGEILGVDLKQRKFYCPDCQSSQDLENNEERFEVKYAILKPNTSESTELYCTICDKIISVERKNCVDHSCKGNVIDIDIGFELCLTCNNFQS